MIALDSSVIVAALVGWHEHHEIAIRQLARDAWAPPHAVLEAYAVVTRLPPPRRLTPSIAVELLTDRFARRTATVPRWKQLDALARLAAAGVSGGASYDGIIALQAHTAGATLVSLDRRATVVYERLGVSFELIEPPAS